VARGLVEVEGLTWDEFTAWFGKAWEPGDHLSVIAPTKAGKTTFVSGLLGLRKYVLALDPKGGDETLSALRYPRLTAWPGEKKMERLVAKAERDGHPTRWFVGSMANRQEDWPALKQACAQALEGAYNMGGWTVYADELQILADRRMMDLSGSIAKFLIAARGKGVTFVSSFQSTSWIPSEAKRQPYWVAASYTRDEDTIGSLAELMGRSRAEMRGAIAELDEFVWIIVGRNPREPLRLVKPPKVNRIQRRA
jgi:hypothetical protein